MAAPGLGCFLRGGERELLSSRGAAGFSLQWLLLGQRPALGVQPPWLHVGPAVAAPGLRSAGSVVAMRWPSCPAACGIFPDPGSNLRPLRWQADSSPLSHKGSPMSAFRKGLVSLLRAFSPTRVRSQLSCRDSGCTCALTYFSFRKQGQACLPVRAWGQGASPRGSVSGTGDARGSSSPFCVCLSPCLGDGARPAPPSAPGLGSAAATTDPVAMVSGGVREEPSLGPSLSL